MDKNFLKSLVLIGAFTSSGCAFASDPAEVRNECPDPSKKAVDTTIYWVDFESRDGNFYTKFPRQANGEVDDEDVLRIIGGPRVIFNKSQKPDTIFTPEFFDKKPSSGIVGNPSHFDFGFGKDDRHKIYIAVLMGHWEFSEYDGTNPKTLSFELKNPAASLQHFCGLKNFTDLDNLPDHKVIRFYFDAGSVKDTSHPFALNMFVNERDSGGGIRYQTQVTIDPKIINNGP